MANSTHTRFDRQAIFNSQDLDVVMDCIMEARNQRERELQNMLSGLYDGYVYNELREKASQVFEMPTLQKLSNLLDKIANESEE